MTQEQIVAIRAAQTEIAAYVKEQEEKLRIYREKHWDEVLKPLTRCCDHTYPWGDTAVVYDYSMSGNYGTCKICSGLIPSR